MSYLDIGLIGWFLLCSFYIASTGGIQVVGSILALLFTIASVLTYTLPVDAFMQEHFNLPFNVVFGFIAVLIPTLFVSITSLLGLIWLDYFLGLAIGFLLAFALLWVALEGAKTLPFKKKIELHDWWKNSLIIPVVVKYGDYAWANKEKSVKLLPALNKEK